MRVTLPIRLYPIALALASVGELFIVSAASPFAAVRAFAVAIVIAVALALLGRMVFGDRDRGGLFAALGILVIVAGRDPRIVAVVVFAVALMIVERYGPASARRPIDWPRISRVLRTLTAVLVLALIVQAFQFGTPQRIARAITHETPLRSASAVEASPNDPDIYMILLDGHARADVLEDVFATDGGAFVKALEDRGFEVSARSRSDYEVTVETLSSMFNMALLPAVDRLGPMFSGAGSPPPGGMYFDAINDSVVLRTLRARGYEIGSIGSGFEEVSLREADTFVDTGELNEFEIGMLRRTTMGNVLRAVAPDAVSAQQRSRIQHALDEIPTQASRSTARPRFLFAHIPSPHAPWVFNADGSPRTVDDLGSFFRETPETTGLTKAELIDGYAGQVADIDRRLLSTLDRLEAQLDATGRPSIVVVFSDHGTWVGADGEDRPRRVDNLLAAMSTDGRISLAPDLTLVALFPSLFEQAFGPGWQATASPPADDPVR